MKKSMKKTESATWIQIGFGPEDLNIDN